MATLKMGSRGIQVRKLQLLLNSKLHPHPRLRVDGLFGHRTHRAVLAFQKFKGLKTDGTVGHLTWGALGQKACAAPVLRQPPSSPQRQPPSGTQRATTSDAHWMKIAQAELGIHENALPGQHNQRIIEYHKTTTLKAKTDETPWCSAFVNWVITTSGFKGTNSALAKSWLNWGKKLDNPVFGAITIIKRKSAGSDAATGSSTGYHVAFYTSATEGRVRLLGGNQSDQVKYSNFSLSKYDVKGYRLPE